MGWQRLDHRVEANHLRLQGIWTAKVPAGDNMERVLIAGASGPIGTALLAFLSPRTTVVRVVRGPVKGPGQVSWDLRQPLSPSAVSGFDTVIHLAGESVFGRWTSTKRTEILESRVRGTSNLASALVQAERKPKIFICASAVGFYGDGGDTVLTEESSGGNDFPAKVCQQWEGASRTAADAGI